MAKSSGFANGRFDARPDRYDFRDETYRPPAHSLPEECPKDAQVSRYFPAYAKQKLVLDQGNDGACTGFGLACVVNYLLWVKLGAPSGNRRFDRVSAEMLYQLARRYDEWPGEQYEGSSCRGALKGWHKHGVCTETLWPQKAKSPKADWQKDAVRRPLGVYYRIDHKSAVAMQAAIAEIGAIYVSARVHDGWDRVPATLSRDLSHRTLPMIPWPKSARRGGHAFALVGYNERGFVVQNSWGMDWGAFGFAVLPYDDWSEHGDDAWVAALGAPVKLSEERMRAMRWPARSGRSLGTFVAGAKDPNNQADDPWPIDREYSYAEYRPWSTATAYEHTLVTGNDGRIEVSDLQHPIGDTKGYAQHIAYDNPAAWLKKQKSPRLMIYAHGGLNSAAESIDRVRVLAPYFKANGVYPLFLTWKTGPIETLLDMLQDALKPKARVEEAFAAGVIRDAVDRGVEGLGRVMLRGIWTEMRENAARGAMEDHGLADLAQNLVRLRKNVPGLGVHLVGHSAGSILLGHLLPLLRDAAGKSTALAKIASCTLYAPACSVRFAAEHYGDALKAAQLAASDFRLHVLSDKNEKDDALPTPSVELYGKSLLYFVSRALDDVRKMPLLGFERAARPGYEKNGDQWEKSELPVLQDWLKMFTVKDNVKVVTEPRIRTSSHGDTAQATHGSFDNNVDVITQTIEALTGTPPVQPLEWLNY